MAWFDKVLTLNQTALKIAHFTDCHLFAEPSGRYFGVECAAHLRDVLTDIAAERCDLAIFGGDITQDHSLESYVQFLRLVEQAKLGCPVVWLPGNHDELAYFEQAFKGIDPNIIHPAKWLNTPHINIALCNSKSDTPAGWVTEPHMAELQHIIRQNPKDTLVFCHHHPLPIKGYLDKHILENGIQFLRTLAGTQNVKHVFHGHVHHSYQECFEDMTIYATPATCIQFVKHSPDWLQEDWGPSYRLINIDSLSRVTTQIRWLKNV